MGCRVDSLLDANRQTLVQPADYPVTEKRVVKIRERGEHDLLSTVIAPQLGIFHQHYAYLQLAEATYFPSGFGEVQKSLFQNGERDQKQVTTQELEC